MELKTQRLILTKYQDNDFTSYFELAGDERVMKMITGKGLSLEEATSRFQILMGANRLYPEFGFYKVFTKHDLKYIGLGKLTITKKGEAEVGYMLSPDNWRAGYGTEITIGLIEYAKTFEQLQTLIAVIDPANAASQRILEKVGFTFYETQNMNGLPTSVYRVSLK